MRVATRKFVLDGLFARLHRYYLLILDSLAYVP